MITRITLLLLFLTPFISHSQWESTTLSQLKTNLKGISVGERVYFIGGQLPAGESSDIIDVFDSSTNEWSTIQMPEPAFRYYRSVELDNKLYIQEDYSRFVVYDLITEEWTDLETPHSISNISKMGSSLIISGYDDLSIYDTEADSWESFTFTYRGENTLVAADGKIIIAGGSDSGEESDLVEIFDVESEEWSTGTLSIPRDELKSIYHNNKVYFIGGEADAFKRVDRIDILDLTTNEWSIDSFSVKRWDFDVAIYEDKIYIAGGQVFALFDQFVSVIDVLDSNTGNWETLDLPTGRSELTAVTHKNKIYFAGGRSDDNTNQTDVIDIYEPNPTSIINSTLSTTIDCYPNPTSNQLIIKDVNKFEEIIVNDLNGKIILKRNFDDTNEYVLNVSVLDHGIYFLSTSSSKKPIQFSKI